ncbi:MAG: TIM barrel protein [Aggregatilineales bacterium]
MTYDDHLRFGTVGAPQTTHGSGTLAAIEHIAQLGLHHLEIAWTRSVRVSDETCADIKATAEKFGISLSVHAPYFINLNSQTDELMGKSDERLLIAARKGFLAGATDIVFHPGSYHGQDKGEVYAKVAKQLKKIRQILDDEGVSATLRPETMGKSAMFGNLEETVRLSAEIDGVLPCVDWAHLHARTGDGTFNTAEEFAQALNMMRAELGEEMLKQVHFHMSGIAYTAKGEKEHLPLIEADMRYRELLKVFVDYGLAGTIAVEAPKPFHTSDALHLQATYRRIVE